MPYDSKRDNRAPGSTSRSTQNLAAVLLEKRKLVMEQHRLEIHNLRLSLDLSRVPTVFVFYTRPIGNFS